MQLAEPQCWQDGKRVVVIREGELPQVCVRCGEPGVERLTRKLSWSSPWLLLLVLLALILYVIVASIVAKRSRVTIWVCAAHAAARRRDVRLGWIGLGMVALWFAGVLFGGAVPRSALGAVALAELILLFGGAIVGFYGYFRSRLVRASRIDDRYIWVKGVTPLLRNSLPPFVKLPSAP